MKTSIALIVCTVILALVINHVAPRYEIIPVANSTNPAVWKLDRANGDVYLCATASSKEAESGCSVKMKQF